MTDDGRSHDRGGATGAGDAPAAAGDAAAHPPAGPPARTGPRPFGWLFDDPWLKLFALVLAIVIWMLVDLEIRADKRVDVLVDLEGLPASVRLVSIERPRVTLHLSGSTGAVDRAMGALDPAGRRITLNLEKTAFDGDEGVIDRSDPAAFAYPFSDAHLVERVTPAVHLEWYRTESATFDVARPRIVFPPDRRDVEEVPGGGSMDRAKVTLVGPHDVIADLKARGGSLTPDDVDATEWLAMNADFATAFGWTSGFSALRAADPVRRSERTLSIEPATISGRSKLRQTGSAHVELPLALLYPAGLDASAYAGFEVTIAEELAFDKSTRRLGVDVRGDPTSIAALKKGSEAWTLLVRLPPPPKDENAKTDNLAAPVELIARRGPGAPAGASSLTLIGRDSVFVTFERKKP